MNIVNCSNRTKDQTIPVTGRINRSLRINITPWLGKARCSSFDTLYGRNLCQSINRYLRKCLIVVILWVQNLWGQHDYKGYNFGADLIRSTFFKLDTLSLLFVLFRYNSKMINILFDSFCFTWIHYDRYSSFMRKEKLLSASRFVLDYRNYNY